MKSKLIIITAIAFFAGLLTGYFFTAKYVIYVKDKEFESTIRGFAESKEASKKFSETYYQGRRQLAPALEINRWIGEEYSLEKLKGKVVLLDFWGIQCGSCVTGMPEIQTLHEKYKDKGLVVIAVHSSHSRTETFNAITDFVEKNNYSFSVGMDSGESRKKYAVYGLPSYYLIDKKGFLFWGPNNHIPQKSLIEYLLVSRTE